jgi:hypothetical protein
MKPKTSTMAVLLFAGLGPVIALAAATEHPKTTRELVTLCSTPTTDPMYPAAVNYCSGFVSGAIGVEQQIDAASRRPRMFCIPNPPPTYDQTRADFAAWLVNNSNRSDERPADGLFAFLGDKYPCPKVKK